VDRPVVLVSSGLFALIALQVVAIGGMSTVHSVRPIIDGYDGDDNDDDSEEEQDHPIMTYMDVARQALGFDRWSDRRSILVCVLQNRCLLCFLITHGDPFARGGDW
jgi:hypothetical protein